MTAPRNPVTIHVAPGKDGAWDVQVHHWTPAGQHASEGPVRTYSTATLAVHAAEESQRRRHAAYGPGRSVTVTLDPATETALTAQETPA